VLKDGLEVNQGLVVRNVVEFQLIGEAIASREGVGSVA